MAILNVRYLGPRKHDAVVLRKITYSPARPWRKHGNERDMGNPVLNELDSLNANTRTPYRGVRIRKAVK